MKIALIIITYNDDYKFQQWLKFFSVYKKVFYKTYIVDNNSKPAFKLKLKKHFHDSTIIFNSYNGGTTRAYNIGIIEALKDKEVDSIFLLANDIKITTKSIVKMHQYLFSNPDLGMVSPLMLEGNSKIISDFGSNIGFFLNMIPYKNKEYLSKRIIKVNYSNTLTGGVNLAKREFYEIVGLQDENLFMYSDEIDIGIRAKRKNFKFASISEAKCWHCHINSNNLTRSHWAFYLISRNKIYLAFKHYGIIRKTYVFIYYFFKALIYTLFYTFKNRTTLKKNYFYMLKGSIAGLLNDMNNQKVFF